MSADMTIEEFCALHHACAEGREWAIANCATMRDVWDSARPHWLIWVATRPGVLRNSELRLFAVFCARQVQHLMADPRSLAALDVAERHARGNATDEELAAARAAAWDAWDAARDARAAAWDAWAAAVDARAAAVDAWRRIAGDAGAAGAAAWLRENTKPDFARRAEA